MLKLAVILALWAAVVAAFVSVLYRRQSDIDQAKVRDLKLVYDLQLDREISARREYELSVESQLRRELTSELRAQAADEVAGLRAELAALRANLEILFDADFSHRPALETDRTRAYTEWPRQAESTGRVTSRRIDTEDREDVDANTEENPIIDVPAEPHPPEAEWGRRPSFGGAHRRPSETEQEERRRATEPPREPPRACHPRRHPRSRNLSLHPSPNSLGSQRNKSARPRLHPNLHRAPNRSRTQRRRHRAPNRSRTRRRRRRIGSPRPRRESGYPRGHRAATGVVAAAGGVGRADGRKRLRRRICRHETGIRARDAVAAGGTPPRPPLGAAGRRRSGTPARATDAGRRIRGPPAARRARAAGPAAGGASTPERRGHRRAVGCRPAGEATGGPDGRQPSQAP